MNALNGDSHVSKRQAGITLIELMTVMVVVAILTAIAIPSYRNYMIRTNRSEAKAALMQYAAQFERCFTNVSSYTVADGCAMGFPIVLPSGNYSIDTPVREAEKFTLEATPLAGQVEDKQCGKLSLTSTNVRDAKGTLTPQQCWAR